MGQPVAVGLAGLVGLATAYCLARCLVPRWRLGHGIGVDVWHVLMGAAMVAMLLSPVGSGSATVQAAVFGVGALWCACALVARDHSGGHGRLGVACAVMTAMLMPAVVATPARADLAVPEHRHVPGMDMAGMAMPASGSVSHAMTMPPAWLAVLMLVGVVGIVAAVARAAVSDRDRRTPARLGLACEVVMAGAMGYMAALTLLP